jgi:hypothetical protein
MKFRLAEALQHRWVERPPAGWTASREVALLDRAEARILGYQPKADLMLQHLESSRRVWIELEISRADPVANPVKFGSAHLLKPLPPSDSFVSLVSRDIAAGRANLTAHAVWLLRSSGLRAFQMPLLPELNGRAIKLLNQGKGDLNDLPTPDLGELLLSTEPVCSSGGSGIYRVTNRLEVFLNIHQWNKDMTDSQSRTAWGRRRVRYFVHDPRSNLFAPSKFAAYTRIPEAAGNEEPPPFNPAMTVRYYSRIPHDTPIFDGRRAWHRIASLGFHVLFPKDCQSIIQRHFKAWLAMHSSSIHTDFDKAAILVNAEHISQLG